MSGDDPEATSSDFAPRIGTVERWAWDFIASTSLVDKLAPPPIPRVWEECATERRLRAPGRPPELALVTKSPKMRGLFAPTGRAKAIHTFLHHELQAAELMAWAILAFPSAPEAFRSGLLRIATDEVRHMGLYAAQIERLGYRVGSFAVRDWFWERVANCETPASFVAVMGLGFESANLEHAASFAARFREAGDEESARVQELVGREEIEHVRFGVNWFRELSGALDFETWREALPFPLSPMVMRGQPLETDARLRAGYTREFIAQLEAWKPVSPGF